MCSVSMVIDHQHDVWKDRYINQPTTWNMEPTPRPTEAEIAEFYQLLERAREYDKAHGEPDCEMAEKKAKLQELADELGVKINFDV